MSVESGEQEAQATAGDTQIAASKALQERKRARLCFAVSIHDRKAKQGRSRCPSPGKPAQQQRARRQDHSPGDKASVSRQQTQILRIDVLGTV